MAKFTGGDLRLKDGQHVTWGTDLDCSMSYDGVADQLGVTCTISGVTPTEDYHLTTRLFVNTAITNVSGSLQTQITTFSDHNNLTNLNSDDHTQYSLADGTRAFTGTVGGIIPVASADLTTKQYVDDAVLSGIGVDHGGLGGLEDDDHILYVPTDGSRGFTSTVSGVDPTLSYHLATKSYVDSGGTDRHGRTSIGNGVSFIAVTFSDLGHTDYTVNATLENITDSPPSIYAFIVSARASTGFTVTFMGDTDSVNYVLNWTVIED